MIPWIIVLSRVFLVLIVASCFYFFRDSRRSLGLSGFLVLLSVFGGLVFFIDYPDTPTADLHWEPSIFEAFVEAAFVLSPIILFSAVACLIYAALNVESSLVLWLVAAYGAIVVLLAV